MNTIFKKMSTHMIAQSVVSIAMGLFLLLWPKTTLRTLVYILGGYLCIAAVLSFIVYFRNREDAFVASTELISGMFQLIMGILVFLFSDVVIGMLPVLLGIIVVLDSLINLTRAFEIKKSGDTSWPFVLGANIVLLLVGIVVIINPFASAVVFTILCGVVLLIKGIMDLFVYFMLKKTAKE